MTVPSKEYFKMSRPDFDSVPANQIFQSVGKANFETFFFIFWLAGAWRILLIV